MVLEQFLDRKIVLRHTSFAFFLSFLYVFVAYFVQDFFFPDQSMAIVLLLALLLVPSMHHLAIIEEKIERSGSTRFWERHKTIIKLHFGAFLGLLSAFFVLGIVAPESLYFQATQLEQTHLAPEKIAQFMNGPFHPTLAHVLSIVSHNLLYMLIAFVMSIFYGAGATFLIVYTSSLFAAFVLEIYARWPETATQLSLTSLAHMLPESIGFILTAIAGATVSRALIHEKVSGTPFRNVLQNCVKILSAAVIFIILAAFIEVYITAPLFSRLI